MRLLETVEGSALWLLKSGADQNLREAAERRGIDPKRLVFADRVSPAEHLARHAQADLFLDTFRYNAHTTASDALWAGLPLVTLPGRSFAARVAASLLTAMGLPELIAETPGDYERLALALATDPQRLAYSRKNSPPPEKARRSSAVRHSSAPWKAASTRLTRAILLAKHPQILPLRES